MRLRRLLKNTNGSSLISVLVAFVILLGGIAGFARAVQTANDMVRRAEQLSTATGKMLSGPDGFYASYAAMPVRTTILRVYETNKAGEVTPSSVAGSDKGEAFRLHGLLRTREYDVSIKDADGGETAAIKYQLHFYK